MQKQKVNVEELRRGGVIALKEKDMFSVWVKTACCNLNTPQLRRLADITDKYARGFLLFSSRQIPIIPFIRLDDIPEVKKELAEVDMELDRCGPRVRNLNVCYEDKICPHAIVNGISLGEKLEHFFRSEILHKIKIGVSGCSRDCVVVRVLSDIGFIGVGSDASTGYYDAYVGGRLGVNPFLAKRIAERITEDEALKLVQNYFDFMAKEGKPGERAADLINRLGEERVRRELTRDFDNKTPSESVPCPNRQEEDGTGKVILKIRATSGEVTTPQLRKIADIADEYGLGFVHFAVRGAPEVPGVDKKNLGVIGRELRKVDMRVLSGIENLQTCYGRYCSESLMDTQSILAKIEKKARDTGLTDKDIRISASGCPNACGIPHISDIGFFGIAEPEVNVKKCTGCGLCVSACKRKAIRIENGKAVVDKEKCRYCAQCIAVCPLEGMAEKRRGLTVMAGGKEGEDTRLGETVAEWISEDEALRIGENCLKLMKEKKSGASGIIDEVGFEEFRKVLLAETK